jgi:hypothetical protein
MSDKLEPRLPPLTAITEEERARALARFRLLQHCVEDGLPPAPPHTRDRRGEEKFPLLHDLPEDEAADTRGHDEKRCAPHDQRPGSRCGAFAADVLPFKAL